MSSQEYISSNVASASYRPKGYGLSLGLQRARRTFRVRNSITGIAVASFAVGVWAYSISAVKQDVFDDVDEQARALNAADVLEQPLASTSTQRLTSAASIQTSDMPREADKASLSASREIGLLDRPRGVLYAVLCNSQPWLFEPIHKTFVWGAPPVDYIGRIEDKVLVSWRR